MRKLPVAVLILEVFVYEDDKRYVGHWFMFRTMHISSPIHLHTIELISTAVVETDLLSLRGYSCKFDFREDHANKKCELELKCNRR